MQAFDVDAMLKLGALLVELVLILVPVYVAFARRDKDALAKLVEALPRVYEVVAQERRKGLLPAGESPVKRALELTEMALGRSLSITEGARARVELAAIHERRGAPSHTAKE